MLADPRRSRVVLINLTRGEQADMSAEFGARRRANLSLLALCKEVFDVVPLAVGEYEPRQIPDEVAGSIVPLDIDGLCVWRDQHFMASLAASNIGVVFLGGVWLEEEVLVTALKGVKRGYDVRVLTDLSVARVEADRSLALDRLALHGVLATTLRQTLLEWAMCLDDRGLIQRVRQLLA